MGTAGALAGAACLSSTAGCGRQAWMSDANDKPTREERLAAKLRENLRRRKSQVRELDKPTLPKKDPSS